MTMKGNKYLFMIGCLIAGFLIHISANVLAGEPENRMNRYNVIWNTPSKDATGVMPIGVEGVVKNGKIASLKVTPESRRKDVIIGEGWE